jgi:hypothetical protein
LDFTTKDNPITSYGVTARVNVIDGTVAFGFLQHFLPLKEYPLLSNLFTDQGYSSIATGIYPLMLRSARRYNTIFLLILVK